MEHGPARAIRETQVHVAALDHDPCARAQCTQSHPLCSIALSGVKTSTFLNFSHFEPNLHKDLQHTRTQKQHKILYINTAKSLTNISQGGSNIQYLTPIKYPQTYILLVPQQNTIENTNKNKKHKSAFMGERLHLAYATSLLNLQAFPRGRVKSRESFPKMTPINNYWHYVINQTKPFTQTHG